MSAQRRVPADGVGSGRPAEIRSLCVGDAEAVSAVHAAAFPGYFLTEMGRRFLTKYYHALIREAGACVGAWEGRELTGFIVGGDSVAAAQATFYRENFAFCCREAALAFGRSAIVRAGVRSRIPHLLAACRAVLARRAAARTPGGADWCLLSIAVRPDRHGSTLAAAMLAHFEDLVRARGVASYVLSVRRDNARAIRFYERAGMRVEREAEGGLYYRRRLIQ